MKYLALLKDSFREAIDTKVFYVMAGLSGLVILVVASLGFTPRPATDLNAELETTLNLDLASLVRAAREQQTNPVRHDSSAAFHIVSVEAIDGQLNRPTSSLFFASTLITGCPRRAKDRFSRLISRNC